MKKEDILAYVRLLAVPVLTVLLGLILLFSPDTASALVGKILGWVFVLAGAGVGAGVFLGEKTRQNNRIVWAVIFLVLGIWILREPLMLAKILGRVLGLTLMILGGRKISRELQYKDGKVVFSSGLIAAGATALIGLVLVMLPLTTSRLVFTVVGVVLIGVGIAEGIDRIRGRKLLNEGGDPNIIDVEKLEE